MNSPIADINYLAVIAATVAGFIFGAVYYMVLAKPWAASIGKTPEQIRKEGGMRPALFMVALVAQLVMAVVLASFIGALGAEQIGIGNGVMTAFFVWLGFVVTAMAVNHGFQGANRSLTVIDSTHWLGVLLIQGVVIGWIGA